MAAMGMIMCRGGDGLNGRQEVVLELLEDWGFVTNGEVRRGLLQRVGRVWCDETIRQDLAAMVEAGVLVRRGVKKGTWYELRPSPRLPRACQKRAGCRMPLSRGQERGREER